MEFGLDENTINNIKSVFQLFKVIDKIIIFGSRVKGNYKAGSDIDFAAKGNSLTQDDISSINVKLDELDLTFKIDLVNYHTIKEPALKEHIDRVGVVFYSSMV